MSVTTNRMDQPITYKHQVRVGIQKKLLFLFFFLALIPLISFAFLTYEHTRSALVTGEGGKYSIMANMAMSQLEKTFYQSKENVKAWAQLEIVKQALQQGPMTQLNRLLRDYQQSYGVYGSIVVSNMKGQIVAADDEDLVGESVVFAEWYRNSLGSNNPTLGKLRLDPYLGGYGVAITAPVYDYRRQETPVGLISAKFSWRELLRLLNSIKVMAGGQNELGYSLLVDSDGFILAAPDFILFPENDYGTGDSPFRVSDKNILQDEVLPTFSQLLVSEGFSFQKYRGKEYLISYSNSQGYRDLEKLGWSLFVFRDAKDALGSLDTLRNQFVIISAFTAIVIFFVSYWTSKQFSQPVKDLTRRVQQIDHGHLNVSLDLDSDDEIGVLAEAFDQMRGDIQQHVEELSEVNIRYQELVNSVEGIVWESLIRPQRYVFISEQAEAITGYAPQWYIEHPELVDSVIYPDDRARIRASIDEVVDTGSKAVIEYRLIHHDGHIVWLKGFVSPVIIGGYVKGLRGVAFEIGDVKQAEEDMQKARDIALKTAKAKSDFLAIMSHELRTPMNGVLGMLELVDRHSLPTNEQEYLSMAFESGRNLLELVNDVLDFSKLEEGHVEFESAEFNVRELVEDVLALMAHDAHKKNLDIGLVCERNSPETIKSDPARIRQVLVNLIGNAVKFTHHGSIWIWVELTAQNHLYVEVKDTGVGISHGHEVNLFEPFVQADLSTTREYGGTGLGLSLCKRIVDGLGGNIDFTTIKGVGSSFHFDVPVELVDQKNVVTRLNPKIPNRALSIGAPPATEFSLQTALKSLEVDLEIVTGDKIDNDKIIEQLLMRQCPWCFIDGALLNEQLVTRLNEQEFPSWLTVIVMVSPSLNQVPAEYNGKKLNKPLRLRSVWQLLEWNPLEVDKKDNVQFISAVRSEHKDAIGKSLLKPLVLLVDDNLVNQKVGKGYLSNMGVDVDVVENGLEAVRAVQKNEYQMIFMDCQMPVMDGYEATRKIRDYEGHSQHIPIVAVTANAMDGDREKCIDAGMDDYIPKPVNKNVLKKAVERWIAKSLF